MKQGRSLTELAQELERQRLNMEDLVAPSNILTLSAEPAQPIRINVNGSRTFGIGEIAHDQISEWTDIPRKYYNRLKGESPELLAENVNYWMHKADGKRMLRTLDGNVRAFLSDRYRPLDNYDLAQAVLPAIVDMGTRIESCEVTEKRLYLKAVTPKIEGEIRVGDVVQAGLVISNSEVGAGSLTISPMVYRLICRNGAIGESAMRRHHVGGRNNFADDETWTLLKDDTKRTVDEAFWKSVRDVVAAAFNQDVFNEMVQQMRDGTQRPILVAPTDAVEVVTKRYSLMPSEKDNIIRYLCEDRDYTAYGLCNAITRTAQEVNSYDRATELESLGASVLTLAPAEWRMIAGQPVNN